MKRISLPYLIAALGIGLLAPRKLSAMELASAKKASIQTIELKSFTPKLNTFVSIDSHSLHEASANGLIDIVKAHLEAGKNINARDKNGNTPLHYAAYNGQLECLKTLLEAEANINAQKKNGLTPLHYAAHKGHLECLKALVAAGANINARDKNGNTPLHWTAYHGQLECLKALVAADANIKAQTKDRQTSLHWAAGWGHPECLIVLVTVGANKETQDKNGLTPLQWAVKEGKSDCAALLIKEELQQTSLPVTLLFADSEKFVGQFPVQISPTLNKPIKKKELEAHIVPLQNITLRTWNFINSRIDLLFLLSKLANNTICSKVEEEMIEEYSSLHKDDIVAICSAANYLDILVLIPIIQQAYTKKLALELKETISEDLPSDFRDIIYEYTIGELRKKSKKAPSNSKHK